MHLGASLRGGEERVEEVRVGVLGLEREVGEVRTALVKREGDVRGWLGERRAIRGDIEVARGLLAFEDVLMGLERKLGLRRRMSGREGEDDESEDGTSEEEEDEEGETQSLGGVLIPRLTRRIEDFSRMVRLVDRVGEDHPFIQAQRPRVAKCREALLSDLGTCLKQLKTADQSDPDQKLDILRLYREIKFGESNDERVDWL